MEKIYFEVERLDATATHTKDVRTLAVPAELYEPFTDVVDYLAHSLRELFGDDVEIVLEADKTALRYKELAVTLTHKNPHA